MGSRRCQYVREAYRAAGHIRRVHQRVEVSTLHHAAGVDHVLPARGQRHALADPQQNVRHRALQVRAVRRARVVQGDRVVHDVTHLGQRVPRLVELDRGLEQVHFMRGDAGGLVS